MGLIREIQGVNATINKQERARRERERLVILKENYKKELESDLKAEFLSIYRKADNATAYKIIVLQKDVIIEKIYNIISKITYNENEKKYLTYSNFDIVEDLEQAYYKILAKVKKEIQLKENISKAELLERLENKLTQLFDISNNKYCASLVAKKNDMRKDIINSIAQNEHDKNTLKDNYSRILQKVIKQYDGDIITEKTEIQDKKRRMKEKQVKTIASQLLFGHILGDISKSLPPSFSKGKGR